MSIFEEIYGWGMFIIIVVAAVVLKFITDDTEGFFSKGDYGDKVKAIIIYKWVLGLILIIVNLVSLFARFEYSFSVSITLIFNLISFFLLSYDTFFKQVKREEYIVALQDSLLQEIPLVEVFEYSENVAKYDLSGNDSTMLFKIIRGEKGLALSREKKEKNELLIPRQTMEEAELKFLCEQINIYWTKNKKLPENIKLFDDKTLYGHRKEFIWFQSPKLSLLHNEGIRKKIEKIAVIILILLLVAFAILNYFNVLSLEMIAEWINASIDV